MPRARLGTQQLQRKKTTRSIPWLSRHLLVAAHQVDPATRAVMVAAAGRLYDLQKEINLLRVLLRGMTTRATHAERARP